MRFKNFKVKKEGKNYHLTRMEYPLIKLTVEFGEMPILTNINIQECPASAASEILKEVEGFIQYIETGPVI